MCKHTGLFDMVLNTYTFCENDILLIKLSREVCRGLPCYAALTFCYLFFNIYSTLQTGLPYEVHMVTYTTDFTCADVEL